LVALPDLGDPLRIAEDRATDGDEVELPALHARDEMAEAGRSDGASAEGGDEVLRESDGADADGRGTSELLRPTREVQPTVLSAEDLPLRMLFDQIADKWSALILATLYPAPQRFNEIKRRLKGITQKALTQALRRLERNGIVARRVITHSPISVEYSVTPLRASLKEPFEVLYQWTIQYLPEVERARLAFDQREKREAGGAKPDQK
jgi:DNA-binding HxlR family transcriptional regulator